MQIIIEEYHPETYNVFTSNEEKELFFFTIKCSLKLLKVLDGFYGNFTQEILLKNACDFYHK